MRKSRLGAERVRNIRPSKDARHRDKATILDSLAKRLDCDRTEVNFLFAKQTDKLVLEAIKIPDVGFH